MPGKPWIIAISILGIIFGWMSVYFIDFFQQNNLLLPTLLIKRYPDMNFNNEFMYY